MSEEGAGGARRSGGAFPSLEQMVAASPGKTPISLLQEYGTRLGRTPGYDLLKAEGQAHQPNFTFRVTLGDISCTGAQQEGGEAQGGRGGPEAAQRGGGHAGAPGAQLSFPPGAPRRARPRRAPPRPPPRPPPSPRGPPLEMKTPVSPPPGRVQPRGGSAGAGGAEGLAPARVHGDAGVGAGAPQGVHHDVPRGEIRGDRQRHLQEAGQAQRGRQDAGEDPQRAHGAARRQRGRGRGGPVQHDVPPAGGAAGPRPRLHVGLAAQLGGREAGPAAEPGGQPRAGGGLRPPAGALGGAELRHQLPRHRRAEPQRAAPVPGGAVHAADHGVPRHRPVPRRRPRPGRPQRAAVPAHHGRGQVSPAGAREPCPGQASPAGGKGALPGGKGAVPGQGSPAGAREPCPGQASPAQDKPAPPGTGTAPRPPGSARTSGHGPHPRPPRRPRCGWTDRQTDLRARDPPPAWPPIRRVPGAIGPPE
ncbi:RISC-loading complex subunit TARBP2 isoform X1 [Passer domesticus]|uniref:RISC-loading complex subunit TARBP2 isoform X1 n=1 Tax=Passer domesticus TaxID=48849 RepID=UPI0030FEB638